MLRYEFRVGLILLIGAAASIALSSAQSPQQSAQSLREQLKEEQERAKALEQKKRQLESMIESRQKQLHQYENILYNYRYNLEQAQKVIDAAEEEIKSILKRRQNFEALLHRSVQTYAQAALQTSVLTPVKRMQRQTLRHAAAQIAHDLFKKMRAEAPRLKELQNLIDDRLAYQARIVNEYMPADIQRMEKQEQVLNQTQNQAQKTRSEAQTVKQQVAALRQKLSAAEEKIAQIRRRRQEEEKRRQAAEREQSYQEKARQARAIPFDESDLQPLSQLNQSMPEFSKQQGVLLWPAKGNIIRPFGEYTHPEFQVKMQNHGIDVEVPAGSTLRAAAQGRVQFIGTLPSLGNTIIIDHGQDFMTIYSNIMAAGDISKGVAVKRNTPLGLVMGGDSQGRAIYHFEVRKGLKALNPLEWINR